MKGRTFIGHDGGLLTLETMMEDVTSQISDTWLDLQFLGVSSEWNALIQDFIDHQVELVQGVRDRGGITYSISNIKSK